MRVTTPGTPLPDATVDPKQGVPDPIRRAAAAGGLIAFPVAAIVWVLSFVPGSPTATWWSTLLTPGFVLAGGAFAVFVIDTIRLAPKAPLGLTQEPWYWVRARRRGTGRWMAALPGWRGRVATALFAVAWLSFMLTIFLGGLGGSPQERDGRFISNDHGNITEITRDEYLRDRAAESRLFSGHMMAFSGIAVLYFTQPRLRRTTPPQAAR